MAKSMYRLKGHESFYLREGWLTKGLREISKNSHVFYENSGADALGVGTNMAKAIRYWLRAAKLIEESQKEGAVLSPLGSIIYENDPYIEDAFSLWIIHINIVRNFELATSWSVFFNDFDISSFRRDEMIDGMKRYLMEITGDLKLPDRSIKDDCSAIVSMYANDKDDNQDPEDKKISPFAVLGLLNSNGLYLNKEQPDIKLIDPLLVLYIIRDRLLSEQSLSIDTIVEDRDMPGKIMNLSRVVCNECLDRLADREYIVVNRTAGLDMVYPQLVPELTDILLMHFKGDQNKYMLREE